MFTVAVIGPDGAGKSAVTRRLQQSLPLPVKYVYMGVNLESSNVVLPTTRIALELKRWRGGRPDMAGPPDPTRVKPMPKNRLKRLAKEVKTNLRLDQSDGGGVVPADRRAQLFTPRLHCDFRSSLLL